LTISPSSTMREPIIRSVHAKVEGVRGQIEEVPEKIRQEFENESYHLDKAARGFVFNSNAEALIRFLEIGTRQYKLKESAEGS